MSSRNPEQGSEVTIFNSNMYSDALRVFESGSVKFQMARTHAREAFLYAYSDPRTKLTKTNFLRKADDYLERVLSNALQEIISRTDSALWNYLQARLLRSYGISDQHQAAFSQEIDRFGSNNPENDKKLAESCIRCLLTMMVYNVDISNIEIERDYRIQIKEALTQLRAIHMARGYVIRALDLCFS